MRTAAVRFRGLTGRIDRDAWNQLNKHTMTSIQGLPSHQPVAGALHEEVRIMCEDMVKWYSRTREQWLHEQTLRAVDPVTAIRIRHLLSSGNLDELGALLGECGFRLMESPGISGSPFCNLTLFRWGTVVATAEFSYKLERKDQA